MPIYEYRCASCGHELEAFQKMSDEPLVDCPECEEPKLHKLISPVGFRLKGSGWYETDFKDSGKKNLADSGEPKKGKTKNKDSKSDSKPKSDTTPKAKTAPEAA